MSYELRYVFMKYSGIKCVQTTVRTPQTHGSDADFIIFILLLSVSIRLFGNNIYKFAFWVYTLNCNYIQLNFRYIQPRSMQCTMYHVPGIIRAIFPLYFILFATEHPQSVDILTCAMCTLNKDYFH